MTDKLDNITRTALIEYRLQRAKETLDEAHYNAKGRYYNAAVNRLYYACFYAALALLVANNLEANTHKGVKLQLGLHFVRRGQLESEYASIYQQLFNNRLAGDYEEFVFCNEDTYNDLAPKATAFVNKMLEMIEVLGFRFNPISS